MEEKDRRSPLRQMNTFHKQASEVLGDDFWQDIAELIPNMGPRIDIYYTSSTVVVQVELPGLQSAEQINISLEGQSLVVKGEVPRLYPVTDNRITLKERFFGSFQRSLTMPMPVSANQITAKYSQGLLTIELQIEQCIPQTNIEIEFT